MHLEMAPVIVVEWPMHEYVGALRVLLYLGSRCLSITEIFRKRHANVIRIVRYESIVPIFLNKKVPIKFCGALVTNVT